MTHTLESEEIPPPMPSSWRIFGSGEPITERKIESHSSRAAGRSRAWKITALDVPPRMNTAGNFFCGMGSPCGLLRSVSSAARQTVQLTREQVLPALWLDFEQADPVHEIGVAHDTCRDQREADVGSIDDAQD